MPYHLAIAHRINVDYYSAAFCFRQVVFSIFFKNIFSQKMSVFRNAPAYISLPEPHPLRSPALRYGAPWQEAFPAAWAALFPEPESPPALGSPE